jgi:DNA-binding CsgD family transcriptional regulator
MRRSGASRLSDLPSLAATHQIRSGTVPAEVSSSHRARNARAAASDLAVARLVIHGATDREVAQRLYIAAHTVNSHLRHVFAKLGIRSRVELARRAGERQAAELRM